ncbi:hypothetical protein GCM10010182_67150 [Actinomadura cremea]|nr:hypothetical protein GCM10010182_67150 [Actinomadura cremea]
MSAVQELAAAVVAALTVPDPGPDAEPGAYRALLARRSGYVQGCLEGLAFGAGASAEHAIAALGRASVRVPVDYPVAEPEAGR